MGFTTGLGRRLTLGVLVGLVAIGGAVAQSRSDDVPAAGLHASCNAPVSAIRWIRVAPANETVHLDRWCAGVGPPLVRGVPPAMPPAPEMPVLVTWNTHEGGGNIDALVADLKAGRLTGHPVSSFVLLLQEVYRSGPDVPARAPAMPAWAAAELSLGPDGKRDDIGVVAERLKLAAYYVPSMRNGEPGVTTEDRGNAILSTLPLSNLTAIELPLERQRRVALQATVSVPGPGGTALPLHLVCTHFTNMVMHHLWVLSESGRLRQARALSTVLPAEGALVVAGDFNAWFGDRDAAVKELAKVVPHVSSEDRRATFGPMRLDHVLARLPPGWRTTVRRADSRYGSDHYPLVAIIEAR
jgi:endonuclease/exonuclease/phosphatase family metal-dependent hydrolase